MTSEVDDTRNGWGTWTVDWRPDTPPSVILAADPNKYPMSLVRVYAATVNPGQIGTAPGLWTGLLMRSEQGSIGGHGPTWLAGTPGGSIWEPRSGSGPFTVTDITYNDTTGTLTAWLTATLSATASGLTVGYVGGPTTKKPGTITAHTVRTILDSYLTSRFGIEWRINDRLQVDVGYRTQLYPETNVPLAAKQGGRDPGSTALIPTEMALSTDWGDWLSGAVVRRENGTIIAGTGGSTVPNPGTGAALNWRNIQDTTGQTTDEAGDQASATFRDSGRVQSARISATEYDLTSRVPTGSMLDVWDPVAGFYDQTAAERYYRGDVIRPVRLRVEGVKWPIQEGMSVWLDRRNTTGNDADLIDLTPHVQWADADADTVLTVGAVPARIGRRR